MLDLDSVSKLVNDMNNKRGSYYGRDGSILERLTSRRVPE
jgi:hypothetical protein